MSTAIFQMNGSEPLSPDPYKYLTPVQLFLAITLPLTAFTLSIWAVFHQRQRFSMRLKGRKYFDGTLT